MQTNSCQQPYKTPATFYPLSTPETYFPSAPPFDSQYPDYNGVPQSQNNNNNDSYLCQKYHEETKKLLCQAYHIIKPILEPEKQNHSMDQGAKSYKMKNINSSTTMNPVINIGGTTNINNGISVNSNSFGASNLNFSKASKETTSKKEKDDNRARVLVGIIGIIVTFVSAYFFGKAIAENNNERFNSTKFSELKETWKNNSVNYQQVMNYQNSVEHIIKNTETLLYAYRKDLALKIAIIAFSLLAGSAAAGGAIIGAKALMITGLAIGVVTTVGALIRYGYNSSNSEKMKELAEEINHELINLNNIDLQYQP